MLTVSSAKKLLGPGGLPTVEAAMGRCSREV